MKRDVSIPLLWAWAKPGPSLCNHKALHQWRGKRGRGGSQLCHQLCGRKKDDFSQILNHPV